MVKYGTSSYYLGCSQYGLRTLKRLVELVYTEELYRYLKIKRHQVCLSTMQLAHAYVIHK